MTFIKLAVLIEKPFRHHGRLSNSKTVFTNHLDKYINGAKSGTSLAWKIKNQMFNLVRVPSFGRFNSAQVHQLIHGNSVRGYTFNLFQRLYFGTPTWAKAVPGTVGGRIVEAFNE